MTRRRLVRPSVTLVCLHKRGEDVSLDKAGDQIISLSKVPDRDLDDLQRARFITHAALPRTKISFASARWPPASA